MHNSPTPCPAVMVRQGNLYYDSLNCDIMPKYEPNSRFSDCWASAGDVTFYHRDGVCFWKKRSCPVFPGTPSQLDQLEVHHRALESWKSLDHDTQLQWNLLAKPVVSHKPPFDGKGGISGFNLFVSAYHGFAQLGDEHIPIPAAFEIFPVFVAEFSEVEAASSSDLVLRFRVMLPECLEPIRYRLMTRLQFTSPGRGRQPGYLRSHIAVDNCTSSDCIVEVPVADYVRKWDLDLPEYQVHCRYLLIDSNTGYRCNFKKISFPLIIPR